MLLLEAQGPGWQAGLGALRFRIVHCPPHRAAPKPGHLALGPEPKLKASRARRRMPVLASCSAIRPGNARGSGVLAKEGDGIAAHVLDRVCTRSANQRFTDQRCDWMM